MYSITFKVTGKFEFPLDMLRYDQCYPVAQVDVAAIAQKVAPYADKDAADACPIITLSSCNWNRFWGPTAERWKSFGWQVVENSRESRKAA